MVGTAAAIASLIGGLASAGGSIAQGVMGSNAAHEAANAQASAADKAAGLATSAADKANAGIGTAVAGLSAANDKNQALLSPYTSAGTTTLAQILAGLQPGGQFNREFTASDMEKYDPGYQFRLQQGQQAIERSAAARGTQLSGGTLKDLTDYQQGAASAEYQNAFNRYMSQIQQTYGMMSGVTNLGLSATNSAIQGNQWLGGAQLQGAEAQGSNTMTAAQIAGNAAIGAGNAKSAGIVGGNNALWGGVTGAINTVGQLGTLMTQPQPTTAAAATTPAAAAPTVAAPTTPAANGTSYIRPQVVNPYTMPLFLGQVMRPQAA